MTWVHDRLYAAGGEVIPADWAAFARQTGIAGVLHLTPEEPQPFAGPPARAFLWMAIADERQADAQARLLAARFLEDCLQHGLSVLLHSSLGRHRTRWAYVALLILRGVPLERALRQAAERPWLAPYRTDRQAWQTFAELAREART